MDPLLNSDSDFFEAQMQKHLGSLNQQAPAFRNRVDAGEPKDFEKQDYRNTNPAAGTGEGSPNEPIRPESY